MARINFNAIPFYRLWRTGTNKKAGSFGQPGSKLSKKLLRASIKDQYRKQRLQSFHEVPVKQKGVKRA